MSPTDSSGVFRLPAVTGPSQEEAEAEARLTGEPQLCRHWCAQPSAEEVVRAVRRGEYVGLGGLRLEEHAGVVLPTGEIYCVSCSDQGPDEVLENFRRSWAQQRRYDAWGAE